jgi:hypothetical protein
MRTCRYRAVTTVPRMSEENNICDECGAFEALVFGNIKLCVRCYSERGSCCQEAESSELAGPDQITAAPAENHDGPD